jgi:integration host factor subunit alpha
VSLTKAAMARHLTHRLTLPKPESVRLVESVLGIIKEALTAGEDVLITGFGRFRVQEKAGRKGRNPLTGEEVDLPARKVVTFKCSGKLRDRLNT